MFYFKGNRTITDTGIGYGYLQAAAYRHAWSGVLCDGNAHGTTFGRVAHSVHEQVQKDLGEPVRIHIRHDVLSARCRTVKRVTAIPPYN